MAKVGALVVDTDLGLSSDMPDPLLSAMMQQVQDGAFVIGDGCFLAVNKALEQMVGLGNEQLLGLPAAGIVAPQDRHWVTDRCRRRARGEAVPEKYECRLIHANGVQHVDVLVNVTRVTRPGAQPVIVGTLTNVTRLTRAMQALEEARRDFDTLVENLPDVFFRTDEDGRLMRISPSCEQAIGYRPDEVTGRRFADLYVDPESQQGVIEKILAGQGKAVFAEAAMRAKDGREVWVGTNSYMRFDAEGRPRGVEGLARVMTERKHMEDELRHLSQIDPLTDAYNRRYFMERSEQQLAACRREGLPAGFLLLDIDWFKRINDEYGHPVGDEILRQFTRLCATTIRRGDVLGRMGGEEFAILMSGSDVNEAVELAERLRRAVASARFRVDGREVLLTASAGVAGSRPGNDFLGAIYARADQALYEAKRRGRNQVVAEP